MYSLFAAENVCSCIVKSNTSEVISSVFLEHWTIWEYRGDRYTLEDHECKNIRLVESILLRRLTGAHIHTDRINMDIFHMIKYLWEVLKKLVQLLIMSGNEIMTFSFKVVHVFDAHYVRAYIAIVE